MLSNQNKSYCPDGRSENGNNQEAGKKQVAINFFFCLRLVEKMGLNSSHPQKQKKQSDLESDACNGHKVRKTVCEQILLDFFLAWNVEDGSGPRLGRAKQNRTKKSPSCSRYLIQNLPTALLLSNRTNQQQTQSHMQVQFVVGSLPRSERFFPG